VDESVFWLEMIRDINLLPQSKLELIIVEGMELTKILGASRRSAVQKLTIKN
jgi:hypothetical protein